MVRMGENVSVCHVIINVIVSSCRLFEGWCFSEKVCLKYFIYILLKYSVIEKEMV